LFAPFCLTGLVADDIYEEIKPELPPRNDPKKPTTQNDKHTNHKKSKNTKVHETTKGKTDRSPVSNRPPQELPSKQHKPIPPLPSQKQMYERIDPAKRDFFYSDPYEEEG